MKRNHTIAGWLMPLALGALAICNLQPSTALAQGTTAFSYQGRLNGNGSPANGLYDLRFEVWDGLTNGNVVAGPVTNAATGVNNGLFSVTVDFGPGVFTGPPRWLELDVRTNCGGTFTTLLPRQQLLATPYAISANTASNLLGTLPVGQLSGKVANSQLANNSITVTAGTGLSGGGMVALGGTTTLNNAGVLSVTGNQDITASTVNGAVTLGDTATSAATPGTLVKRDDAGGVAAVNLSLPATSATAGIIYASGVPLLHSYGSFNIFAGENAGNLSALSFLPK